VLSAATQLRIGGIGPGDFLLGLVSVHSIIVIAKRSRLRPTRSIILYSMLIIYCGILSLIPVAVASVGVLSDENWLRQYFFVLSALIYPFLLHIAFGAQALNRIALVFAIGVIIFFGMTYALVELVGIPGVANVSFNYSDVRFRGWALNPNQTALVIGVAVPLLLREIFDRGASVVLLGPFIAAGVVMGLATGSDALLVAWALGIGLVVANNRELGRGYRILGLSLRSIFRSALAMLAVGIVALGVIWLVTNFETLYQGTGMGAGQGEVRVALWLAAFAAFLERPFLGNGPGHFSGLAGPYQGSEAHSLLFDWLASYGMVGSTILAIYVVSTVVSLIRKGLFSVLSIVFVVLALSAFHFFARHPVFWFALFFAGCQAFDNHVMQTRGGR
jgi:hypothetical protein